MHLTRVLRGACYIRLAVRYQLIPFVQGSNLIDIVTRVQKVIQYVQFTNGVDYHKVTVQIDRGIPCLLFQPNHVQQLGFQHQQKDQPQPQRHRHSFYII